MEIARRYRVNVSRGMKGNISYDCTVEITITKDAFEEDLTANKGQPLILAESDALVAELDKRYPKEI